MTKIPQTTAEIAAELADDENIKQEVEELIEKSKLIKMMIQLRLAAGLSQKDVAEKMGCNQSTISRIEAGTQCDLKLGEFSRYLGAVGCTFSVLVDSPEEPIAFRIKHLVLATKGLLDTLTEIIEGSDGDKDLIQGMRDFRAETLFNMLVCFDAHDARHLQCYCSNPIEETRPQKVEEKTAAVV